jgi:type IV secretory pathway VirD2 relaxase
MRWRAQEIATQELGPRHEFEIRRAHSKEITQERFTSLDKEIERLAEAGRVEARTPRHRTRIDPAILISRLEHLEVMGLRTAELQRVVHAGRVAEGATRARHARRHH